MQAFPQVRVGDVVYWYATLMETDPQVAFVEGVQINGLVNLSVLFQANLHFRISVPHRSTERLQTSPMAIKHGGCWETRDEYHDRQEAEKRRKAEAVAAANRPASQAATKSSRQPATV